MISNRKWSLIMAAIMVAVLVLSACAAAPTEVDTDSDLVAELEAQLTAAAEAGVSVEELEEQLANAQATLAAGGAGGEEPTEEAAEVTDRTGTWVDTVVVVEEPSAQAAFQRLESGDIDVYAFGVSDPEISALEAESDVVDAERSFGSSSELTFNPSGPEFADGRFNPFSNPRIREAMNRLIDREYIVEEIYGGLAVARWVTFNTPSSDYALYADIARQLENQYSYDVEAAEAVISEEMEAMGAELVDDQWTYNGEVVTLILLIRTEDERMQIGDYLANQLESIGFVTDRQYKAAADASPCWLATEPAEGCFHIYTGGWVTTAVPRDTGTNFAFYYTPLGLPRPLWVAYTPSDEFLAVAEALNNNDFASMDERRELFEEAMVLSLQDSSRVWVVDRSSIGPRRADISIASDLYGGIYGSWLWPYTLRRGDEIGGSARIAMPSILTQAWNPIAGSNWIYDQMLIRGTANNGTLPDPFTGLPVPQRIANADVVAVEGLPIRSTADWVTLNFEGEIAVPEDAWVDWDAETQTFITAADKFPDGATALSMSTVYYPEDLYTTITWHDGSPVSAADFVMGMILTFDQAKEASPYFDAAQVPATESFLSSFKGVKIISTDPLIIETYTDAYGLDAETNVFTWWPYYTQGEGSWHALALGLLAEEAGETAFSPSKAGEAEIEHLSYISGPSIDVLDLKLEQATTENWVPFAATMDEFLGDDEAADRYANLAEFSRARGHYWIGTGPFYLERAFPVEGNVILQRYQAFPDSANKWAGYAGAPIADVTLEGPSQVTIGEEAEFVAEITLDGEAYDTAGIDSVSYLVFDATGALVLQGTGEGGDGGLWTINLSAEDTEKLAEGSNRIEVVVVSNRVALPTFTSLEFVTTP